MPYKDKNKQRENVRNAMKKYRQNIPAQVRAMKIKLAQYEEMLREREEPRPDKDITERGHYE